MRKVIALLFFIPAVLFSQQQVQDTLKATALKVLALKEDTSKVNSLNRLSMAYIRLDSAKAFRYSKQALQLADKLRWEDGMANSYYHIAFNYSAHFIYGKSLKYFEKALTLSSEPKTKSKIYTTMGSVYTYKSAYSKALGCYHQALKIDESLGDREGIGELSMNIGTVYYSLKEYPKAIAYFKKALQQKVLAPTYNAVLLRDLAVVYNSMQQYDKALDYFKQSLAIGQRYHNNSFTASLLSDIALVYYDMEDYQKAIRYSKESLATNTLLKDKVNIAFSQGIIGDSYLQKAKLESNQRVLLDSAVYYLGASIALHKELNSIRGLYDDYTSLADALKLQGKYKDALESYTTSIVYKDSLFNSENRETIKNLEDKRSIEIRDRELQINRLKLETEKRQQWFLVAGLALLGIIGALLLYQNYNRKKTNLRLNLMNTDLDRANKVKTRLLSILNHDLRSPLSSFIHFIQLQRENPDLLDESARQRIENNTLNSAKKLLHSMEDILLWTKDQMEHFEPHPRAVRIDTVFADTADHFSTVHDIDLVFECDPLQKITAFTDENYLKTILRNLTSNAINAFSDEPEPRIVWKAQQQNNRIILSISDNGPGAVQAQFNALYDDHGRKADIKSGLGLHLARELAKSIQAEIHVKSILGEGTTITLTLPADIAVDETIFHQ